MAKKFKFPFEKQAQCGVLLEGEEYDLLDKGACAELAVIYRDYEMAKDYDGDDAAKAAFRKKSLLRKKWEFQKDLAKRQAELWRRTELAASACRKDPTPENALRLCDVLVGLGFKERPLDNANK